MDKDVAQRKIQHLQDMFEAFGGLSGGHMKMALELLKEQQHEIEKKEQYRIMTMESLIDAQNSASQRLSKIVELQEEVERYKSALEQISDILDGQNVTPLVERIAYVLGHSGIYDKS